MSVLNTYYKNNPRCRIMLGQTSKLISINSSMSFAGNVVDFVVVLAVVALAVVVVAADVAVVFCQRVLHGKQKV